MMNDYGKVALLMGTDYFDELLERIRDIRASEKRFYQKILDLFKLLLITIPTQNLRRNFLK